MRNITFTDQCIMDIESSIHVAARGDRIAFLGPILRDWAANDLREHLLRETNEDKEQRKYRLNKALKAAKALARALDALNDFDSDYVGYHAEHDVVAALYRESAAFIPALERAIGRPQRGHPSKLVTYLVVCDAAAIYKYLTGKEATRTEAEGSFTAFCTPIWNAVFGEKVPGFTAAMKKLEHERQAGRGASPLMANLRSRQPSL